MFQEDYCEGRYLASAGGQAGKSAQYACEECEKTFSSPGKLRQHEYTHTGETPFECKIPGIDRSLHPAGIIEKSLCRLRQKVHIQVQT